MNSPTSAPTINIISRLTGVGLDRDVELVREALSADGFQVSFSHCRSISPLRRVLPSPRRFEINIFLERIFSRWLSSAGLNVLIPNQERFPSRHLRHIDLVLCKSRHAEEIFSRHGAPTGYIGFTSTDQRDPEVPRHHPSFLHLAGRSTLKGTEAILDLWGKHPEWPTLTLIQCPKLAPQVVPGNVKLHAEHLPAEKIVRILNASTVHLCPSRSEGWGHYIVEAMSCGALVITTDAPPMNELVTGERGLLVAWNRSEPRHLGSNFFVSPSGLEAAIQCALELSQEEREDLGRKARSWFEVNQADFRSRLGESLRGILAPAPEPEP